MCELEPSLNLPEIHGSDDESGLWHGVHLFLPAIYVRLADGNRGCLIHGEFRVYISTVSPSPLATTRYACLATVRHFKNA